MVLAHHVVSGAYGFWLPNDPRGSWSEFVASWELFRYGPATKTTERRSLAQRPHSVSQRLESKTALSRTAVQFTEAQRFAVAAGFADYIERSGLEVYACSVLPDHVHLTFRRFRLDAEQVLIQLKAAATRSLVEKGIHPFLADAQVGRPPKCFARGGWTVFLDSPEDIMRAIRYVEANPVKEGLPRQYWDFVTPYRKDIVIDRFSA